MDNSTDLALDVALRGIFTVATVLGIAPNAIIIFLFYRNPRELQSYGVFQITFALTELICTVATWLTMNRMYIITSKNYWYVPIGPCNYLDGTWCEYAEVLQTGCIYYLTMLIPMSFIYRYYVVTNGAPQMRNITTIVLISIIPTLIAVPLLAQSLTRIDYEKIPICLLYYCIQFNKLSSTAYFVQLYATIVSILFLTNFVFAILILRKLKKHMSSFTVKTANLHKMLTTALILHSLVHLILALSSGVFILISNKTIIFPYCDVLPTLIYSIIPFLNGMVCLCFVPQYRLVLRKYFHPLSHSHSQRQFLHTHERY